MGREAGKELAYCFKVLSHTAQFYKGLLIHLNIADLQLASSKTSLFVPMSAL